VAGVAERADPAEGGSAPPLVESARRVREMLARLERDGYATFSR
jgi:hypothetical protein